MEAPRLTAVVVLPTPPFWLATARTVPMAGLKLRGVPVGRGHRGVGSPLNAVVLRWRRDGPLWLLGVRPVPHPRAGRSGPQPAPRGRFTAIPARRGNRSG